MKKGKQKENTSEFTDAHSIESIRSDSIPNIDTILNY